jgi:hypothetical protein
MRLAFGIVFPGASIRGRELFEHRGEICDRNDSTRSRCRSKMSALTPM